MLVEDFDFDLPDQAIARHPTQRRDGSRLLVLDRARDTLEHRFFSDLPSLLGLDDLLVVNDTRVLAARLRARKVETGGKVEILLVEPLEGSPTSWRAMLNASKPVRAGALLEIEGGGTARATRIEGEGFAILELSEP